MHERGESEEEGEREREREGGGGGGGGRGWEMTLFLYVAPVGYTCPCNGPRVMQRKDRQKKNSTCNLTTVKVHVSGVFTQRTQISPLTLDVTTNRYFTVQRGTVNIF